MKYVVTEGLARWQLATGDTLLEGLVRRIGRPVGWFFLPYLVIWSFFVTVIVTAVLLWPGTGQVLKGLVVPGAIFSSLLGVWQAVPYLFADTLGLLHEDAATAPGGDGSAAVDTRSAAYRGYLVALAIVPMAGLFWRFQEIQKLYAIIGATFIPFLAIALLVLNGRAEWVGERFRNRPAAVVALLATLGFFLWIGWRTLLA